VGVVDQLPEDLPGPRRVARLAERVCDRADQRQLDVVLGLHVGLANWTGL
jgi:hypothetical protein